MARAQAKALQLGSRLDWYLAQLRRLKDCSRRADIPVLVVALSPSTQAKPERCPSVLNAHDCRVQAGASLNINSALAKTQLHWLDGQRFFAAAGRSDFMLRSRKAAGPVT